VKFVFLVFKALSIRAHHAQLGFKSLLSEIITENKHP
jgi:hypothetical protein